MKSTLAAVLLCTGLTLGQAQSFIANLDGAQDGGGARQGIGTVSLSLSGTTISLSGSYSGLTTASTGAHIHGPSGLFPASAAIIYHLDTLGLVTIGSTSGTYSGSFTLADIGAYTVAQQISDLDNSLWYLNVHDSTFPGGEIRGQIVPVPEPSSLALLGCGTAVLACWLRRRV